MPTDSPIQTMEAGQELKDLVATTVMGWHQERVLDPDMKCGFQNWVNENGVGEVEPDDWNPDTDWRDAGRAFEEATKDWESAARFVSALEKLSAEPLEGFCPTASAIRLLKFLSPLAISRAACIAMEKQE